MLDHPPSHTFDIAMDFLCGRVTRNIGILPVSSTRHLAWSVMSRLATGRVRPAGGLGSLHDPSGSPRRIRPVADWKPKLLLEATSCEERETNCQPADAR